MRSALVIAGCLDAVHQSPGVRLDVLSCFFAIDSRQQPIMIVGMDEYTVGDVVKELGISRQRVNVLCSQLDIGRRVGPQRTRILSRAEVRQLDQARQLKYTPERLRRAP